jgi:hypothetical protein
MLVLDLATDTLRQLGVISEIETPSAEQGQDAVTKLNDLMASLAEDGIDLGYNPKATTADSIVLPAGHVATIKAMLGVALAESYGLPPPPVMSAFAEGGYKRLLRNALHEQMHAGKSDAPRGENNPYTQNILTGQ